MNNWKNYYPRPSLKRNSFFSLDGTWLLNNQEIEVPFVRESKLSNYQGDLSCTTFTYEKEFALPNNFKKRNDQIILHFGAIDQIAEIYLNDVFIIKHEGGYLPIDLDITNYLKLRNTLKVIVSDKLDNFYPYGKQSLKPKGMWYTAISGIWQSVWLEAVPKNYIKNLKISCNLDKLVIDVYSDALNYFVSFPLRKNKNYKQLFEEKHIEISLNDLDFDKHLWSLDDPYLYPLKVTTNNDEVESYFAIRSFEIIDNKLYLNKKPLLLAGVLDQGYFQDGIFLPSDPQEYFNDVLKMKELGFNFLRKHIKLEPEVFYYACDKLGMLVLQDMVNSGPFNFFTDAALPTIGLQYKADNLNVDQKRYDFFIEHSKGIINKVYNHPCIIAYTIYNEGWGQQKADEAYQTLKQLDPERLFDSTSGWFKQKLSDFDSKHIYFRNKILKARKKPLLLSECGGYKRPIKDHLYQDSDEYGYGKTATSEKELTEKYQKMYYEMIYPSINNGLCGYIITQLSDVEGEINGFYTYDRQVCKIDKKEILRLNNQAKEMYQKL